MLVRMLARQSTECLTWSHLEQDISMVLQELAHPIREADGLSDMTGPILAGLSIWRSNPLRRHIGYVRNRGCLELYLSKQLGKRLQHWVHHRRVKGVRGVQMPDLDTSQFEVF